MSAETGAVSEAGTGWRPKRPPDLVLAVVEATRRFSQRQSYDDDFTLVVVKRS